MATSLPIDEEGYLTDLSAWSRQVAIELAQADQLELTDAHWELIELVRQFYQTFDHSPAMRPLVKFAALQLGKDKGRSLYLMKLFPGSPAKRLARYAGLPKPDNCL